MAVKCPKCQASNPEDAEFCIQCGGAMELQCPRCGAVTPAQGRFCKKCGHDLGMPRPSPIDYSEPRSYTPRFLADKIFTSRQSIEGERKLVTVLFADVAGYTAMSERLDPEEVHQIMDGCFKIILDEIHRYEGTIDKFTGDGLMALFGAPVAHEDHPQRACYAALAIQKELEGYGEKVRRDCGAEFRMRIGLNSGPVIVGVVGSDLRMDYTAVGDTVNLASRLQTLARPGSTLVSRETHRMTRDFFRFQSLGKVSVKGKEDPVEAYELLEPTEVATRLEAAVIRGLTRFVGRDKEMATLKEAFEKARSGSGQVVGIVGEAGVGKSRLLFEMRRTLPEGQYTLLEGRCLHFGGSMPYLPFLDILRTYFGIEEGDREYLVKKKMTEKVLGLDEKLQEALPPIEDILSLKVEDEVYLKLDPPAKRMRIFEAIRDTLIRESQRKPLVLAVEDLHWIDKTSEEFLGYLIGFLANTPILLLLLYRPEYTHQWASKSYYCQVGVDQLSMPSSAELVQSILEEGEVAPELKNLILTTSAGNPLFMEEFTHSLLENGSIQRKDHQYVLARKASEIAVPDTIQAIIAARMDRLEDNLKRTMQVASVIGRDFAYRILQTITGMREDLKSHLVNLQGLEFIYEKSLFPELEYIFKHALIQEVAYSSLLIKRRKEIHQRIGKAIEDIYADRLEEFYEALAHHYSMSDNHEKAFHYLRLSSIKAGASNSVVESVRFGKEAIAALGQMPPTDENKRRGIEMRLMLTGPINITSPSDAQQMMEEGARVAEEVGDYRSLANLYGTLGLSRTLQGDPIGGRRYGEKAFEAAERTGDVVLVAANCVELIQACMSMGAYARIIQVAPGVLDLLEKEHLEKRSDLGKYYNLNLYSMIKAAYGMSLGCLGDMEKGLLHCEDACRFAEEVTNVYAVASVEHRCSELLLFKGDAKGVIEHANKSTRFAEQGQFTLTLWPTPALLGWADYFLGELDTARQHFEKRLEIYRSTQYPAMVPEACYGLALVSLDLGDVEAARSHIEESLELARKYGYRHQEGRSIAALGMVMGKAYPSQIAEAEGLILDGIRMLEELKVKPYQAEGYLYLGELYSDMGQKEKALASLKKARQMCQEMGMDYWLARTEKALEKVKGQ
jgi:class 3 adenylate cyclase/tetratricopeptide (TPR) repeat protein/ribosomal protein L40E